MQPSENYSMCAHIFATLCLSHQLKPTLLCSPLHQVAYLTNWDICRWIDTYTAVWDLAGHTVAWETVNDMLFAVSCGFDRANQSPLTVIDCWCWLNPASCCHRTAHLWGASRVLLVRHVLLCHGNATGPEFDYNVFDCIRAEACITFSSKTTWTAKYKKHKKIEWGNCKKHNSNIYKHHFMFP